MAEPTDYSPSGFFVLRTPLLPFDELVDWGDSLEAPGRVDDPEALARDRTLLRERLRAIVERPEVREALFVASPGLAGLLDAWMSDPESTRGAKCERALVRYISRMAGRSTPFGLFAGVSTGTIADDTSLVLAACGDYHRTTRLDAGYLVDVVNGLVASPGFRERLSFVPNPSLYRCDERRRYVHSRPAADEGRHRLVSVRESDALGATLAAAGDGARPAKLRRVLTAAGHADERAAGYVEDLIERQVIVPQLEVQLTGADASYGLSDAVPALAEARAELTALDADGLGQPAERYRRIAETLEQLPAKVELDRLFQVDMTKGNADATLGRDVANEILRGAELLWRVGYRSSGPTAIERFAERFAERYESERVPLMQALDPDVGISFDGDHPAPSPLAAVLGTRNGRPVEVEWGPREDHLLARVFETQASGRDELVVDARDVAKLERDEPAPRPGAFAAMAILAAGSRAALAAGRFRVLMLGMSGPSGCRLLGRFCHADRHLQALVEAHIRAEEQLDPDAVLAEIVHLPRARDVNVLARPVLREYEIVCLGGSGAPPERRIPLSDLLVSVEEGRVVLHSRRLGRRVLPRLTSAHNFGARGVSVYRFLCALQSQGVVSEVGFWGPLAAAPFLPRVRYGRVVLASARWRLDAETLGSGSAYGAVQRWRHRSGVPRFVALDEFGGQLPIDLDNALAVGSLADLIRRRGSADLVEFFPSPGELCVEGPEGAFAHELVVPFVRVAPSRPAASATVPATPTRRRFTPGSEWLYMRLYTGEAIADTVLTKTLAPLEQELRDARLADRWFFLRYADPEFHLRVRFHGNCKELRGRVEDAGRALVDSGLVWRFELGTYQREVERYGGPEAIELAEAAFHADSDAVIAMLPLLEPGDEGLEERWQLGLVGVDQLLADLEFDTAQRLALVRAQRDSLASRIGLDRAARSRIGERFRRERRSLERLLAASPGGGHPLEPGLELLRARSARLAPIAAALIHLERERRLTLPVSAIASSLLHMYLNRLLRGDNLAQELVTCEFLGRLYEATGARLGARATAPRN
ncbi:MAG: lantibiotic dehydratase [Solirubrobacteraceae bacterium]